MSDRAGFPGRRRDQSGAASLVGLVLTLVIAAVGIWLLLQSTGMLDGGGREEAADPRDLARVSAALTELRSVKMGLEMRARMPDGRMPTTDEISSMDDLRTAVSAYIPLAAEPSFVFDRYVSTHPDSFRLLVRARDSDFTPLEVTSGRAPRRRGG